LLGAGPAQLDDLVDLLLPVCLRLSEMEPEIQFSGSFEDLLRDWIRGRSLRTLMAKYKDDANSPASLGRFIDDLFRYKLPWGVSGYLHIAAESLDLDGSQLSQYARFLPSMIKYGVLDPTACWALSIGVPSWLVAMKVAVAYEAETSAMSYESFLEWLGSLSRERLSREFELQSTLLEETTRAIFLSSLNPMLRNYSLLREFLPREERVHDIDPDDTALQLRARPGQSVELKRDYDNLVDKNAISVNLFQQRIGTLPRRVAQVLAPEMDTGLQLTGEITWLEDGDPLNVTVRISEV
jgi:helicase